MGNKNSVPSMFITGLMIIVLLILSGIVSMIINIPLVIVGLSLELPVWIPFVLTIVIGIIVLGWTFTRFKVNRMGK